MKFFASVILFSALLFSTSAHAIIIPTAPVGTYPVPTGPATASLVILPTASAPYDADRYISGLSGDGLVAIGSANQSNGDAIAARWVNGTIELLSYMSGHIGSFANGVTYDGSVIVGESFDSSYNSSAVRWVNGVIDPLQSLSGSVNAYASGISRDGSTIVGSSYDGTEEVAVKWVNGNITALASLGTTQTTYASKTNNDGSIIIGGYFDSITGLNTPMRWVNGTPEQLTMLSGFYDIAGVSALNGDGTIIVGDTRNSGNYEPIPVKWVNNVIEQLPLLSGSVSGYATVINESGSVIFGSASDSSSLVTLVRWVNGGAAESVQDLLASKNVNLNGWAFYDIQGVSDDASIIAGGGQFNGVNSSFIANLVSGGITTPQNILQSIASVATTTQQIAAVSSMQMGQSLFQARNLMSSNAFVPTSHSTSSLNNLSTASGGPYRTMWQMYSTGSFGIGQNNDFSNNDLNGTVGVKANITPEIALGGGVIGSTARSDMVFGGQSEVKAYGVSSIAGYAPIDNGLRVYGSMFAAALDLNVRRGYLNGAGFDSSRGETNGFAYGAAGQVGWNLPVTNRYSMMPYTELRYSKTKVDGYTENGGAFAGTFSSQDVNNATGRLGLENNFQLTDKINLMGRVAVAHRISGEGSGVTANVSGISQNLGSELGDKTWGEAAIGGGYQITERTYLNSELNVRSGNTQEPLLTATVGLSVRF